MAQPPDLYTDEYYRHIENGSLRSAREVVPILLEFVRPVRVLDVGCGTGAWLLALHEHGVNEVWGLDIDSVPTEELLFPKTHFIQVQRLAPFDPPGMFDLVLALEVAEHLPEHDADAFIKSLTMCGSVVLFSAAIPGQGGTGHLNEQWPAYWSARFNSHDYVCVDFLRWRIWNNANIKFWFRQNILLFVHSPGLARLPPAVRYCRAPVAGPLPVVHPELFTRSVGLGAPLRSTTASESS
jgi:SAM-dependent methyltransferase